MCSPNYHDQVRHTDLNKHRAESPSAFAGGAVPGGFCRGRAGVGMLVYPE